MPINVVKPEVEPAPQTDEIYSFGAFRLDVATQQLERDGELIDLTPKAFQTLVVLVRHRGRVVTKAELIGAVWPDSFVSDESLSQNIWTLRRVLGDQPSQPQYIATLPRRGYRFIAPVILGSAVPTAPQTPDRPWTDASGHIQPPEHPESPQSVPRTRHVWAYAAALIVISGLAAIAARRVMPAGTASVESPVRFTLTPPKGVTVAEVGALSPDGQYLAVVGRDDRSGQTKIWLRVLRSAEDRPLAGTEGASRPFWSPDSQSIGFFSAGTLRTLDLATDSPRTLANVGIRPSGGSWGPDGTILFTGYTSAVFATRAEGQSVRAVTALDANQESAHAWPQFLPDGRHFLFHVASKDQRIAGTYVGSLDSPQRTRVSPDLSVAALYAAPGYLLYMRGHTLLAHRFDSRTWRLVEKPTTLIADMRSGASSPAPALVSASGNVLAFTGEPGSHHLTWFSRSGQMLGVAATPVSLRSPVLMPNGRQLLAHSDDPAVPGSWLVDLESGASNRVTIHGTMPVPSPDGSRFAFGSSQTSVASDIYVRPIASGDREELLLKTPESKFIDDWSPDGRYIVYMAASRAQRDTDLWLLPMFGDRKPIPFLTTPYNELQSQVSPDGRWLAYASDKSGAWEIYVRAFPSAVGERAISAGGGVEPRWSRDGTALYYLSSSHWLMSVEITPEDSGRFGKPRPLFRASVADPLMRLRNHYMVSADGQRFLIDTPDADDDQTPTNLITSWRGFIQP